MFAANGYAIVSCNERKNIGCEKIGNLISCKSGVIGRQERVWIGGKFMRPVSACVVDTHYDDGIDGVLRYKIRERFIHAPFANLTWRRTAIEKHLTIKKIKHRICSFGVGRIVVTGWEPNA
jgi:hypothetical protein